MIDCPGDWANRFNHPHQSSTTQQLPNRQSTIDNPIPQSQITQSSMGRCFERPRDALALVHDSEQVAAPELADLFLGVAPPDQFERHVEGLVGAVPAVDAAAAVEVRRDADVLETDLLDRVV